MNPQQRANLNRTTCLLGWGDPAPGGLWFIGLEEGSDWKDQSALDTFFADCATCDDSTSRA